NGIAEVRGSIPLGSIKRFNRLQPLSGGCFLFGTLSRDAFASKILTKAKIDDLSRLRTKHRRLACSYFPSVFRRKQDRRCAPVGLSDAPDFNAVRRLVCAEDSQSLI